MRTADLFIRCMSQTSPTWLNLPCKSLSVYCSFSTVSLLSCILKAMHTELYQWGETKKHFLTSPRIKQIWFSIKKNSTKKEICVHCLSISEDLKETRSCNPCWSCVTSSLTVSWELLLSTLCKSSGLHKNNTSLQVGRDLETQVIHLM